MASNPGLGRILFCDKDKLSAAPPINPIALGFRGEAKLDVTPFKTVKEQGGGDLPNMRNFKFEAESYQPTMRMLHLMRGWLNLNCDIEVTTSKQAGTTPKADVYKFVNPYQLGLGFEYTISGDKRSLKVMCEGAFEEDKAYDFLAAVEGQTQTAVTGITGEGNKFDLYRAPYFIALTYGGGNLVEVRDIVSRTFTIKTVSEKDIYNCDIVNKLEFSLEVVSRDASLTAIKTNLGNGSNNRSLALVLKEKNQGDFYDQFQFGEGTLIRLDEFSIGDKERQSKITLKREVSIYDIDFQFGADKGGDAADNGTNGGTMVIG